jgi:hypothetical protein
MSFDDYKLVLYRHLIRNAIRNGGLARTIHDEAE